MESRIKDGPLTAIDQHNQMDVFHLAHGTTLERVLVKYSSEAEYAYLMMIAPTGRVKPWPKDGLTPEQQYMVMIGK